MYRNIFCYHTFNSPFKVTVSCYGCYCFLCWVYSVKPSPLWVAAPLLLGDLGTVLGHKGFLSSFSALTLNVRLLCWQSGSISGKVGGVVLSSTDPKGRLLNSQGVGETPLFPFPQICVCTPFALTDRDQTFWGLTSHMTTCIQGSPSPRKWIW
jgi:hypothetical protein